jgi:anti-sigma B factor antagonist
VLDTDGRNSDFSAGARWHTLSLTGELDPRTARVLDAEIERLCEEDVAGITLDLRELTYIDSTGIAVIAVRCELCRKRGQDFALIPGTRSVNRAFERAGVSHLLPVHDDEILIPREDQAVAVALAEEAANRIRFERRGLKWPSNGISGLGPLVKRTKETFKELGRRRSSPGASLRAARRHRGGPLARTREVRGRPSPCVLAPRPRVPLPNGTSSGTAPGN